MAAASLATTPVKINLIECVACGSTTRSLHGFFNIKAKEENFRHAYEVILGEQFEDWVVFSLKLCPVCAKKCKEFNDFRSQAKERYNNLPVTVNDMNCRVKRMSNTP